MAKGRFDPGRYNGAWLIIAFLSKGKHTAAKKLRLLLVANAPPKTRAEPNRRA